MRFSGALTVSVLAVGGWAAGPAWSGPAVGQFEIKSLSAEPGEVELQSQNAFSLGIPRRRVATSAGGLAGDHNSLPGRRHGLEIEYGFSHHLKARLGVEFENERLEDFATAAQASRYEAVAIDEIGGEVIVVLKRRRGDGFGWGFLVEYEHPFEADGARTLLGGPILEFGYGRLLASFNPTVTQFFGGEKDAAGHTDDKRDFGYAASLHYTASESIAWAIEAYGSVERLFGEGQRGAEAALFGDFDQHRVGPVLYWTIADDMSGRKSPETVLGVGTLFGLNEMTPDLTLKLSLEVSF